MTYRALVTGGAGFIGSHLVDALIAQNVRVRVLDNLSTGDRNNLAAVQQKVELFEGDLRDSETCAAACRGVEVVYHLGALGSVPRSVADPITTNAVNVEGTLHVLAAARAAGVRRLVFSSSSSVYGDTPILPKHEGLRPNPRSPYAVSKLAGEEYCRAFYYAYGLETVILRYFNVFGPRQSPDSQYAAVIPRFVSALLQGRPPTIYGDGQQSRDFTYVSNVVQANLLAGAAAGVAGEVFNIACGEQVTVRQVLQYIAELLNLPCSPQVLPARIGDVQHSLADTGAARERLDYRPSIYFKAGLARTVAAFSASFPTKRAPSAKNVLAAEATI
jgi:UDP-glucose 4-epimerase